MAYFPFYINIERKRGVVLGGGRIAAGKISALLPFSPELICIAPVICGQIERMAQEREEVSRKEDGERPGSLHLIRREARKEDLEGAFFVIAATDQKETNAWAAKLCREKGILINAVDDRKNCTFYFPALVHSGPVTIGISTGGCSPAAASWLRKETERIVPAGMGNAVERMGKLRERVLEYIPGNLLDQKDRAAVLKKLFTYCRDKDFLLEDGELEDVLEALLQEHFRKG
ncbi:MAG TPA: bifunctional precorrin-2 dehydrogenase/sirohydrochlorin ferrochelatase [Candidatus Eisenbergiella merdipullorum]|uniref:precorrin-2 dehydrogenase n=1 Tax=Candidatus Eisenbergiella merdipullorum TaxID=2838553 RepID=A0A9D2L1V0_9FIRM|nr:bifunctional precorrin-2 dehydrogenase/sirohydrochlorin ferrochelatase [Candidatus Eisenbergiella merdipullorum]